MSNRSYVIALSGQTFMHSWRISTQTFVNSVSNKQCSWTHIASRVQQTCAVWAKRTEYSIEQIRQSLQRLKIAKIVRMQNLHNFRIIDSVFFSDTRLRYKLSIIDPRLSQTRYGRALVMLHAHALAFLETTLPVKKTLAQFMTYEQSFICCLSNLPPPIVSIVLRKLAIVSM